MKTLFVAAILLASLSRADLRPEPVPDNPGVNIHFTDARPGEFEELADELRGYRFSRRLALGNSDDNCLVFVRRGDIKLAAWTRSATGHTVAVPVWNLTVELRQTPVFFEPARTDHPPGNR